MRSALLLVGIVLGACGAPVRNVPVALDPSNPDAPEGASAPPSLVVATVSPRVAGDREPDAKPAKVDDNMDNMPGMEHDKKPADDRQGMAGMQPDKPATNPAQASHAKPSKPSDDMPNMSSMHHNMGHTSPPATKQPPKTIYTCPMHPEVTSDKPGRCPKCGMKLEPQKPGSGNKP